jgi:hypothetical protein
MIVRDSQNKADVASTTASQWFDSAGVDVVLDVVPHQRCAGRDGHLGREERDRRCGRLLARGQPFAQPAVALALAHPAPQRLGRAADLGRNGLDRGPPSRVLVLGVGNHAHRAFDDLGGILR